MAAMVDWPDFFKELNELMDEIEKKEKKEQEEKAKKEAKEAKEKEEKARVAVPRKERSEESFYKELAEAANTFSAPILYLMTQYFKKGFSRDEAFTLAVETYKVYINFMLKEAFK